MPTPFISPLLKQIHQWQLPKKDTQKKANFSKLIKVCKGFGPTQGNVHDDPVESAFLLRHCVFVKNAALFSFI